ncbi:MAG: DUF1015 domain-containing protein [Acidobacteria bacterium]|jgi:uncharacterized protein (DUF1015 family)|nr:DUF1015 domain-containing protein [Acidobacteriota bacterium]
MSNIRPFAAYRPRPEQASKVASHPYDVINSEEARELAKDNPLSFLHVCKPEIDLDPNVPLYDDRVYAKGAENLRKFISDGVLFKEGQPCFYVYRQKMGNHVQNGLVALCSVKEYEQGLIKRHEFTRKDKEDDRTRHVMEQNANAEPVFLTYRAMPEIDRIVERAVSCDPVYDIVTDDGFGHTVWVIADIEDMKELQRLFAEKVPALYVADGHHRTAAAVRCGQALRQKSPTHTGEEPFEYFMAVVFPHDQLKIMDYNRVVKDLHGLDPKQFLAKVADKFNVTAATDPRPEAPRSFGMYLEGKWYRLAAKPGSYPETDPVKGLDVSILQDNLLAPVLGIADPRTDKRIDFVGGIRGMKELEKRVNGGWAVAFSLYPTSLPQLMAVADSGQVMPPKSTWFEPKLRSGLLVRLIED